jgi:hypothetical protein
MPCASIAPHRFLTGAARFESPSLAANPLATDDSRLSSTAIALVLSESLL